MNKLFYALNLLSLCALSFGMELNTIPQDLKQAIINASSVDEAAQTFNQLVESGTIPPTIANTRWCINTLADKAKRLPPFPWSDPLFRCAQKLNPSLTREWLAHYLADPDQLEYAGSLLREAIESNDTQLGVFLLSSKSSDLANGSSKDIEYSFAYYSIIYNRDEILALLLDAGAHVEDYEQRSLWAPIHLAAWRSNCRALKLLMDHGANPNLPCREGQTPLFHLCRRIAEGSKILDHEYEFAFLLLDHGADSDIIPPLSASGTPHRITPVIADILKRYNEKKKIK